MAQIKAHKVDLSKEGGHQSAVILWAAQESVRAKWPELALLHHIPNGGTRDPVEAAHLKRQGVRSGVPDLHLPVPRGGYASLYIEMKRPGGSLSQNQRWWLSRLEDEGNRAVVCYGWEEAVAEIEKYLKGGRKCGKE